MTALRLEQLRDMGNQLEHPHRRLASLGIYYVPGTPAQVNGRGQEVRPERPPAVHVCGPLGGRQPYTAEALRHEAARLLTAADTLEAMLAAPVEQLELVVDL